MKQEGKKMKKIKLMSVVLIITMVMSMSLCSYASTFSDVDKNSHEWAIDAIEKMVELGVINGYDDGTFKPDKTVTKLEALVLTSRILGVNAPENEALLDAAVKKYGETVDKFNLSFGTNEVCYLLVKNIIKESELTDYIGKSNSSSGMKRYEVAVLMTKAFDAEEEVSKNLITTLEFNDAEDIPAYAKKYVEYVTQNGIMNGVGDNLFSPNTDVTRAQIALLMNKLVDMTDYTYFCGQVSEMDYASKLLKIKNEDDSAKYTLNGAVILRFEGEIVTLNDISTGYSAILTLKDDSLYAVDLVTPLIDKEVTGIVSSKTTGNKPAITINVIEDDAVSIKSDVKETYPLSADISVSFDDEAATIKDIPIGALVKINVKKGQAVTVKGYTKTKTVSGLVVTPVCAISVEHSDGTEASYIFANEVEVTRNGAKATASDIVSGDTVSLTLTYERISKVVATSKKTDKTGVIQEVIISASPKITVKTDDGTATYPISNSCQIVMPGKPEATFYDLRVGTAVTLKMEGSTVVQVQTTVAEGVTQITGTVSSVNTAYSVIQVVYTDTTSGITVTEPVFVKSKATIVDILTGSTVKMANIVEGSTITAFGMRNSGVFEATTINVSVSK